MCVVFNSLSKRSNLPGMRVGFVAGDKGFMQAYLELRNVGARMVPMPLQQVAVAVITTRQHVEENRWLYREIIRFRRSDPRRPLRL